MLKEIRRKRKMKRGKGREIINNGDEPPCNSLTRTLGDGDGEVKRKGADWNPNTRRAI